MGVLDVRGVRIGEGRPKTIVSVMANGPEELVAKTRLAADAGAELVEWRADYLDRPTDIEWVRAMAADLRRSYPMLPLVFTFRSEGQGGRRTLAPAAYCSLLEAVIDTGCLDLVDIELGAGDEAVRSLIARAHREGARAIVSHHDFGGTPEAGELVDILEHMASLGADIPKLATMAHDVVDCLRLMEVVARVSARLDRPVLALAMGDAGRLSRVAGEAYGSALTFCSVGDASAPGQVDLQRMIPALEALQRVL